MGQAPSLCEQGQAAQTCAWTRAAAQVMDLTRTDKLFAESKPNYYIFERLRTGVTCIGCQKKFNTHLAYTHFCSPGCKKKVLSGH
jgi:hypothetical protein